MTREPANAICLGGPCHGRLIRVVQDIGVVSVPSPVSGDGTDTGTAEYHITGERVHHPSCPDPLVVLHWNHAVISYCQKTTPHV